MRSTGNAPDFIRHTFLASSELKTYTVYQVDQVDSSKNLLTDTLRIEKFQGKSNATNIQDYLRLRTSSAWSKSQMITGLRPTDRPDLFYGDWRSSTKTLLLFAFSEDRRRLFIDVFRGFYPLHKGILDKILNAHTTN